MSVGAIAGMLACVSALNSSKKEKRFKETVKLVRWLKFKSECGSYNVDFSENESNELEKLRIGSANKIKYQGIVFKLDCEYVETIHL